MFHIIIVCVVHNPSHQNLQYYCDHEVLDVLCVKYKDHMHQASVVCYSQVFCDREGMRGIVDYTNYDDMKHAIRKLDDSLFFNVFPKAYIRVGISKF
ncbi:putative nucleotide-binding alpha-beta plait domain superfamily, RNA-binding domain superfamily [Helianthus annuus]|nr:putative nucleotide-binding alpha-beta plait domain superfamily, RNA-binding domain superfamily [Helianthus annuus]